MTKTAGNPTFSGRTYLYSPYKGVCSHPDPPGLTTCALYESDIEDIDTEEMIVKTD